MLKRIDASVAGVWWAETSQEPRFSGADELKSDYDLVVVGGGYCGLSVALHAAQRGLGVLVLEAGTVGCGASGRNGGFAVPHFPGTIRPSQVEALIGRRKGARLAEIVAQGPSDVFDLIRKYQIRCDAEQAGWVQPAHSEKSLAAIRAVYEEWTALGARCEWKDGGEVMAFLGTGRQLGGWYNASAGVVNPFALAQGLARVASSHGAQIREHASVTAIARGPGGHRVSGDGFEVTGRQVVIATNGYTSDLYPALSRTVIPVRLFHTFTRPLSEEERATVLPNRTGFTEVRKSGSFARYDSTNRLISGGAVFTAANPRRYGERHSRWRVAELFPQLKGIEFDQYWEGWCALTPDYLPEVHRLDEGVWSLIGFSTRGVALAQTLGREMARFLSGEISEDDIPAQVKPVEALPFQRTKTFLGGLAFPAFQARDRLGLT